MAKVLNSGDILGLADRARELVEVPEWNGSVWVRALSVADAEAWSKGNARPAGEGKADRPAENLRIRLVILAAVNEQGERLFKDADAAALAGQSFRAIDRLFDAAIRVSGLGLDDAAKAKAAAG